MMFTVVKTNAGIIALGTSLDPGAYKEARDNMGQQFMKEIKEKFGRKISC